MQCHLKNAAKVLFLAAALLFAPVLIPIIIVTLATVLAVTGGLLALCVMVIVGVIPFLFGVFAVPLLFSTVVTLVAYVMFNVAHSIFMKAQKHVVSLLPYPGKLLGAFGVRTRLLKGANRKKTKFEDRRSEVENLSSQRKKKLSKTDSWGSMPSFEKEMEEESRHLTVPANWEFPNPRASTERIRAKLDQEEEKNLIDKIEELHKTVKSLRTPSMRQYSRRKTLC